MPYYYKHKKCELPELDDQIKNTVWVCLDGLPVCGKRYKVKYGPYRWVRVRPWHFDFWR